MDSPAGKGSQRKRGREAKQADQHKSRRTAGANHLNQLGELRPGGGQGGLEAGHCGLRWIVSWSFWY